MVRGLQPAMDDAETSVAQRLQTKGYFAPATNYSVWARIAAGAITYGVAAGLLFRHEWPRVIKSLRRS